MPDFPELQTYFVQAADATPPSETVPSTFADCHITPLIDGAQYFQEVGNAISALTGASGDFVLIANWWLGLSGGRYEGPNAWSVAGSPVAPVSGPNVVDDGPLRLDGPAGTRVLQDLLIDKARAGVDVRVMGWVSNVASGSTLTRLLVPGIAQVNGFTLESVKTLRAEPTIGKKALLNVIAHPGGAVHSKLVVVGSAGSAVGFTGGIDFSVGRYAHPGHTGDQTWHDVAVKLEGPVVQALYDWFKDMWHENISRPPSRFRYEGDEMPSFLPGTPVLPARALPVAAAGTHHVQSLRTVPRFDYAWYNCLPETPPISFAPQGRFEVRVALRKALRAAQTYVHIEDQSFWAQETLSWVNEAVKASPDLRVILVTNGAADPNDPQFPAGYLCHAVNHGLLTGLTPAQVDQVRLFKRFGDVGKSRTSAHITAVAPAEAGRSRVTLQESETDSVPENAYATRRFSLRQPGLVFPVVGNPAIAPGQPKVVIVENAAGAAPTPGEYEFWGRRGITVHAKIYLVDDAWAVIGSANTMRRSLYTDLEHSVAFMDEDGNAVRDFRAQLYADHFRDPNPGNYSDIDASLHAWEPTWGTPGAAPARPPELESLPLPLVPDSMAGVDGIKYDNFEDPDSRNSWGGLCS